MHPTNHYLPVENTHQNAFIFLIQSRPYFFLASESYCNQYSSTLSSYFSLRLVRTMYQVQGRSSSSASFDCLFMERDNCPRKSSKKQLQLRKTAHLISRFELKSSGEEGLWMVLRRKRMQAFRSNESQSLSTLFATVLSVCRVVSIAEKLVDFLISPIIQVRQEWGQTILEQSIKPRCFCRKYQRQEGSGGFWICARYSQDQGLQACPCFMNPEQLLAALNINNVQSVGILTLSTGKTPDDQPPRQTLRRVRGYGNPMTLMTYDLNVQSVCHSINLLASPWVCAALLHSYVKFNIDHINAQPPSFRPPFLAFSTVRILLGRFFQLGPC